MSARIPIDALFRLDAGPGVGFGHAARCLKLARHIRRAGGVPAFEGRFSATARTAIAAAMPRLALYDPGEVDTARVAIIDLMSDPEDPEAWDRQVVDSLRARADATIFIASGRTAPSLPDGVACIGYQPVSPQPRGVGISWGLEFAPVDRHDAAGMTPVPQLGRVLVALGGAPDSVGIESVLAALRQDPETRVIDVLLSPAGPQAPALASRPDQVVEAHRGVDSVFPLLARAELVVASFGSLCYEALHVGVALAVVGQKRFQVECARLLEQRGLALAAGQADDGLPDRLVAALTALRADRDGFRARAREAIDGDGIARIAARILAHLPLDARCASPA